MSLRRHGECAPDDSGRIVLPKGTPGGAMPLKRFAKNLNHRFSRNAVLRSIVARVPSFADVESERRNALRVSQDTDKGAPALGAPFFALRTRRIPTPL